MVRTPRFLLAAIERLPPELLDSIAACLSEKPNLCNLRLVSHRVLDGTEAAVSDGLYRKVQSSASYKGLSRLVQITTHRAFAPAVRMLELQPSYLDVWNPERFDFFANVSDLQWRTENDVAHDEHDCRLQAQWRFIHSEGDAKLLTIALKQLSKLCKVTIGYAGDTRGTKDPDTRQYSGPWTHIRTLSSTEYLTPYEHLFRVFMKAVSGSRVSLESLSVGSTPKPQTGGDVGCFVVFTWLELEPMEQTNAQQHFANLTSLAICAQQGDNPGKSTWHDRFSAFLRYLPTPATLGLRFDQKSYPSRQSSTDFLTHIHLPRLQTLRLRSCYFPRDDAFAFLNRHATIIRSLDLRDCVMRSMREWKSLLLFINDHERLNLDVITLKGMTTDTAMVKFVPGACRQCCVPDHFFERDATRMCTHYYMQAEKGSIREAINEVLTTMNEEISEFCESEPRRVESFSNGMVDGFGFGRI